jgi:hypothetical protein
MSPEQVEHAVSSNEHISQNFPRDVSLPARQALWGASWNNDIPVLQASLLNAGTTAIGVCCEYGRIYSAAKLSQS